MEQTTAGKLNAIRVSFIVLKAYFKSAPKLKNVNYKTSMKIPDCVFEFMLQEINRLEIQCRVDNIKEKLQSPESKIRALMKNYSLKELETAYLRKWKIVVRKELKYDKDYE